MSTEFEGYLPCWKEIAELNNAIVYSYEAGAPPEVSSPWVAYIVGQADGGMLKLLGTLVDVMHHCENK